MNVGVFGIGNILMGDDAFGPAVVARLDALWEFPEGVVVEDLGTPSLDLAARLSAFDAVIVVDAVAASAAPGTMRRYTREQLLEHPPGLRLSPHEPSLKETLLTLDFLGQGPQTVVLIGVVPERLDGLGMSEVVEASVAHAALTAIEELERLGVHAASRPHPLDATPWWLAA